MRWYYIIALLFVGLAVFLAVSTSDTWDETARVRTANEKIVREFTAMEAEVALLQKLEPFPLKFTDDALSDLIMRTIEAGEVLGAGIRVEPRESNGSRDLTFKDLRQGIKVCRTTLTAGLETSAAAPVLAMLEEELADLPVAVVKVLAQNRNNMISLSIDVDVFGS